MTLILSGTPTIPTDTNDYVNSVGASVSGSDLTITLGRTGSLADLTDTVTLPSGSGGTSDGVVNSATFSLSGQDLTLTLGRTIGANVSDTVTLPSGGGEIDFIRATASSASPTLVSATNRVEFNSGSLSGGSTITWDNTNKEITVSAAGSYEITANITGSNAAGTSFIARLHAGGSILQEAVAVANRTTTLTTIAAVNADGNIFISTNALDDTITTTNSRSVITIKKIR